MKRVRGRFHVDLKTASAFTINPELGSGRNFANDLWRVYLFRACIGSRELGCVHGRRLVAGTCVSVRETTSRPRLRPHGTLSVCLARQSGTSSTCLPGTSRQPQGLGARLGPSVGTRALAGACGHWFRQGTQPPERARPLQVTLRVLAPGRPRRPDETKARLQLLACLRALVHRHVAGLAHAAQCAWSGRGVSLG